MGVEARVWGRVQGWGMCILLTDAKREMGRKTYEEDRDDAGHHVADVVVGLQGQECLSSPRKGRRRRKTHDNVAVRRERAYLVKEEADPGDERGLNTCTDDCLVHAQGVVQTRNKPEVKTCELLR